ncbi:SOCS box domain-containing protein [Nephila pilipes]|uniref:SOCS box domain-containing protein n=1 Tax=Nephila pilipes TaxID=299642 RepID=A0A8X6T887_NEPPI|nr:SOCS box domain-containing protein [Nephila pilipes]
MFRRFKRRCPITHSNIYKKVFRESDCVNNDLPFLYSSSESIRFEKVILDSASDVVRYSFVVHKSVTYLDLSVSEYGKREKLCFTMDAFKKKILSRRYILYNYHLDVTKKLDSNFKLTPSPWKISSRAECFFLKEVSVVHTHVYCLGFTISLAKSFIRASKHKIRSVMFSMKLLNIQDEDFKEIFYPFLELATEERKDSELVYKFLEIQPEYLNDFFFQNYKPHLVELALYHATHLKRRLFYNNKGLSWIHSIFSGQPECFFQLIKYGYHYPFFPGQYLQTVTEVVIHFLVSDKRDFILPSWYFELSNRRRNILFHTMFFLFCRGFTQMTVRNKLLLLFWSSIPDPFLTRKELNEVCDKFLLRNSSRISVNRLSSNRIKLIQSYELIVNPCTEPMHRMSPRSLVHLSRCKVREHMALNFQLPYGIDTLCIPEELKNYLQLDIPHQPI